MTTTTTYQGLEPGSKSSSRLPPENMYGQLRDIIHPACPGSPQLVLRPPGGGSNISLGADEEKPPVRKNKMASSVFAEPEDPYANRRNNPPGGKPSGVLCGEPSAPLRRGGNLALNNSADTPVTDVESSVQVVENSAEHESAAGQPEEGPPAEESAAGLPAGRRNPPGGKSSLILG